MAHCYIHRLDNQWGKETDQVIKKLKKKESKREQGMLLNSGNQHSVDWGRKISFEASLGYIARPCLKKEKQRNNGTLRLFLNCCCYWYW